MKTNQSCGFPDKHVKMQVLLNQKPRLRLLSLFNQVAEGHSEKLNGHGGSVFTGKPAFSSEVSTRPESFVQLSLFE